MAVDQLNENFPVVHCVPNLVVCIGVSKILGPGFLPQYRRRDKHVGLTGFSLIKVGGTPQNGEGEVVAIDPLKPALQPQVCGLP